MRHLRILVLVTFLLAALLLVAFGPRPALSHPEGRVVVQYWEKWTGEEGAAMQKVVDDFNNTVGAEKNIFVQYLSLSKVDQKILIATSAGTPPDIAGMWYSQLEPFAAVDALQPLDELAAEYGIKESDYKPIYWEQCKYNGKLYAMISTPSSTALHWNKRIFLENADKLRAAGCDPTRAPWTIDELNRCAAALVTRNDKGRVIDLGFIPQEPGWYVYQLPFWFGGELYDAKTRRLTLNSPECIRAFDWIEGFSKRLGPDAITDFRDSSGTFNSPQNAFLTGHAAMVLQGPWMAFYTESLRPRMNRWKHPKEWEAGKTPEERRENYEWAVAPFPSVYAEQMIKSPNFKPDDLIDNGVTFCATDLIGIPRGAKHTREAFTFIAWLNRMDNMERICKLHCKNTPLVRHSDTWYQTHPNPYVEIFDRLASSSRAHAIPRVPTWPMINEELGAVVQRVGLLQQSPKTALDNAQNRLQAQLDQFRERHPETQGPENAK